MLKVALLQLNSGPEIAGNLAIAENMIRQAVGRGAAFILTPENTSHMVPTPEEKLRTSPDEAHHPALPLFSGLAKELGVWILAGSLAVKVTDDRVANRSYLFSSQGGIAARYDKIHLFDVDLPTGESHRESRSVRPGDRATIAETPWGKVGMSICYDLRFAALYRALAQGGAGILTVPSAFTVPTGQAHWETLLRARAIETGSFVLAPAQTGTHAGGRRTYGHSLIVGPWGEVIADGGEDIGITMADLDLSAIGRARTAIPSLLHDRDFQPSR
ncbi:MAG TPA: carbon-nitrogen hydrolase family protein [Micavibrio sp.]|jgi:predicted amidohydrolase